MPESGDTTTVRWHSALEAIERCYELGWTDGLPVVPPTELRVGEFIERSGRPAAEVVGELPERRREITVGKVAANAVMAGCLPEYMPVVLTATEMASLIGDGLDPSFRGHLDSLQVELLDGRIAVSAKLRTSALPPEALGPLVFFVQEWEPFSATGPIQVVAPMEAEWLIEQLSLRDIPFPREMVQWLVSNALGGTAESGFPVHIPEGVGRVAVHPHGVVLYRDGP